MIETEATNTNMMINGRVSQEILKLFILLKLKKTFTEFFKK